MATELAETINGYGIKKIITTCPHGYNCLKNEYPQFGGNWEVYHHTEFLARLLREGRLTPRRGMDKRLTFHDSCYLGRYNDLYEEPRGILKSIPGLSLQEMERHHNKSFCCGAGGGRMWMEEHHGERINNTRTDMALKVNATAIATACPFCNTMVMDGLKARNAEEKVMAKDIAEIVWEAMETQEAPKEEPKAEA